MKSSYQYFIDSLNEHFPDCCFRGEYKFKENRNFRFDVYLKCCKLAIEIEGGATSSFGHRNIGKFLSDMEKYNLATINGWRLLRLTPHQTELNETLEIFEKYFANNPCTHAELNRGLRNIFIWTGETANHS